MNPTTHHYFTAAQLAAPLNISRRAVQLRLADTPHTTVKARGQQARAWAIADLPQSLRSELAEAADRRGCTGIEQLLADPPKPWTPPLPWSAIPSTHQDNAQKLCTALAPALAVQHQLSGPDLMDCARAGYRQTFGHTIEDSKLRYIMDRATKRDNGFNQFHRPELYLDDAAFRSINAASEPPRPAHDDDKLQSVLSVVADKSNPTPDDRRFIFPTAFRHMECHDADHPSVGERRAFKLSLIQCLYQHVPGLHRPQTGTDAADPGKPLLALRSQFNREYQEWVALGRPASMPKDARAEKCGRKPYTHEPCEKKILKLASELRGAGGKQGNVDLAVTMLAQKKEICTECAIRFHPLRMSAAARKRLTPNSLQAASAKGGDAIRKIAPTHHTEWDTLAGDRFVIDDMTTNEMSWDEIDGEIISGQVQLLYTEDEFSGFPLPDLFYFGPPNNRTIRRALSAVFTMAGLPHLELLTDRGVFANRQLSGSRGVQHELPFRDLQAAMENYFRFDPVPDDMLREIRKRDLGLRDPAFRLKIRQVWTPQIKTVERSFYELQKSTSRLPGFGGFNQRNEMPRPMQDFVRRVKSGKEHPGNEWLHLSDLRKNYDAICDEIKDRPVNGMRHRGRTPRQVWEEGCLSRPLRKLPPAIEAFFATDRIPAVKVHPQGIRIRINKFEDAFYFDGPTGALVDQRVAVRINYDIPDYIYIEEPKTGKLVKVDRQLTRRTTASSEEIASVNRARRAHIDGALGEIGNIKNPASAWIIRDTQHSPTDIEQGAQIAADADQHKQDQARADRDRRTLAHKAAILGTTVAAAPRNAERVNEGLDLESEALKEIEAMQKGPTP